MLDTTHQFLLAATNKSRKKLMREMHKNSKIPCTLPFVQQFQPKSPTMPANVPSPPPTDQLNCRFQQQKQRKQIAHLCTTSLSLLHTLSPWLHSSTLQTAVADKSTQPRLPFAFDFIPLHTSTKSTKPLRIEVPVPNQFLNRVQLGLKRLKRLKLVSTRHESTQVPQFIMQSSANVPKRSKLIANVSNS